MLTPEQEKNVAEWVKALRSGEYRQTGEVLHDDIGFCCLGVACDLFAKSTGRGKWGTARNGSVTFDTESDIGTVFPPTPVLEHFGLADRRARFDSPIPYDDDGETGQATTLASLNDEARWDFSRIADLIESRPPGLFV